ncbi:hypothetical protein RB213_010005 [Colletotrichum asianum]
MASRIPGLPSPRVGIPQLRGPGRVLRAWLADPMRLGSRWAERLLEVCLKSVIRIFFYFISSWGRSFKWIPP